MPPTVQLSPEEENIYSTLRQAICDGNKATRGNACSTKDKFLDSGWRLKLFFHNMGNILPANSTRKQFLAKANRAVLRWKQNLTDEQFQLYINRPPCEK